MNSLKFGRTKISRLRLNTTLAAASIYALVPGSTAYSYGQVTPEDSKAAIDFFRVVNGHISESPGEETVAVADGRASVGYYRVRIRASGGQPSAEQTKGCKVALEGVRDSAFLDAVFARRYDMGLAVSLPMSLQAGSNGDAPESRAEVNLFRLTQTGGKRCGFSLSYFEKEGDYQGPWIPIDHQSAAMPQEAVIRFRPWVSRENNKQRVDAFWTGLGSFVNLLGPVASIGSSLFTGGKDRYEIKGQAGASIFSFTNDIKSENPPEATRRIVVNPTMGSNFTPKRFTFNWDLSGNGGEPFSFKLDYAIDVQYWSSRLFARDANPKFPDLGKYDANKFEDLLGQSSMPGGKAWRELTEPIATLSEQNAPDRFQIACKPAFAELKRLGFSREDQILIVYGQAVAKGFTPTQIKSIDCLFGAGAAVEVRQKLAKFGIAIADAPGRMPLATTTPDDWYKVLLASSTAFQAPSVIDGTSSDFRKHLAAEIRIGGDTSLIANSASVPVLGDHPTPYALPSADFLKQFGGAKAMIAGCYAPRRSKAGTALDFDFPDLSGLPPSEDRSLAFLAEAGDKVFLVVIGLEGKDRDSYPIIDQIWFGTGLDPADEAFHAVIADMQNNTESTCLKRPSFKAFLEGMK